MGQYKKQGAVALGIAVLVFAGILLVTWMGSPSTVTPGAVSSVLSDTSENEQKRIEGQFFSAEIPSQITVRTHNKTPQGIRLEQLLAVGSKSQPGEQLAITVGTLPSDGIRSVSDVQYRMRNENLYRQVQFETLPEQSLAFLGTGSSEISVFWPFKGKYASVVISGVSTQNEELETIILGTLSSWQWK